MFFVGVMSQPGMVIAQRLHLAQLLQPLLLLYIMPTGVGISGDRLREPSLEGDVSASEFGLDGGLEAPIEVRSEELERRSAHTCMRISTGTDRYGKSHRLRESSGNVRV